MRVYSRDGSGLFVMLECYLDDSGTHDSSRVIVWGGIVGHQQYLAEFEDGWNARLENPCEGRPPLKNGFHSYDLARGEGEFQGYNQAERDRSRYNFRKVIVDAGLTWVSYGISVEGWEKYSKGYFQLGIGSAERLIFGRTIMTVCDSAKEFGEPVSFQFDKGREAYVATIIQSAVDESRIDNGLVSHGFSCVKKNVGLQAADLVAHESYRYFTMYIDDQSAKPNAHLARLLEGAHDGQVGWFGPNEIQTMSLDLGERIREIEKATSFSLKEGNRTQKSRP